VPPILRYATRLLAGLSMDGTSYTNQGSSVVYVEISGTLTDYGGCAYGFNGTVDGNVDANSSIDVLEWALGSYDWGYVDWWCAWEFWVDSETYQNNSNISGLHQLSSYNDGFAWNSNQSLSNCYLFALGIYGWEIANNWAQLDSMNDPGDSVHGNWNGSNSIDNLRDRLAADGFRPESDGPGNGSGYRVFVVYRPATNNEGSDYHFYREGPDGTWEQKPGNTPATNIGHADPAAHGAANGNYSESLGIYWVP
jgi:hypothetical protein